jgi:hypothetical protein
MTHQHQWTIWAKTRCGCLSTSHPGRSCSVTVLWVRWHQRIFSLLHVRAHSLLGAIVDTTSTGLAVVVFLRQSPIQVLTTVDVAKLRWLRPTSYHERHVTYEMNLFIGADVAVTQFTWFLFCPRQMPQAFLSIMCGQFLALALRPLASLTTLGVCTLSFVRLFTA